jgi:peptidoglycan hydrolase-like protein with peptidoglycan-binding domain
MPAERAEPGSATPAAPTTLRPGDRGPEVAQLQRRLAELGYWLGRADGTYGELTVQAVLAFQKVQRMPRTGTFDATTSAALRTAERPTARSASGDLIEIDKARQVLFVVRGGVVRWTLNTSTGTEKRYRSPEGVAVADTPPGRWVIDREVDGMRQAALGSLYRPKYFHKDGIAIHGARDVPAYPASHGCARLTYAAMDWLWRARLAPIGSTVWIY